MQVAVDDKCWVPVDSSQWVLFDNDKKGGEFRTAKRCRCGSLQRMCERLIEQNMHHSMHHRHEAQSLTSARVFAF